MGCTPTVRELLVHRLCIASLPMLLLLVACTHERGAARPSAAEATTTPAPQSAPTNPAPSSAPQAPTPAVPPAAADAAAAPALSKAGSQAAAARSSRSPPKKTSPPETTPAAEAIHPPAAPAAAARPPAAGATPALDLTALEQRLRDTHAIGVFTKLSLKNQVDDLLGQFKAFHNGGARVSLAELRQKFELLLVKVVTLLQDDDPSLAAAVSSSRESIWGVLSDPKKFANI